MTPTSPSTATKLTDALLALAELCESATGPDRELDEAIERALHNGGPFALATAAVTASLDAAMTLVPSNMEDRGYYFALEQEWFLPSSAGWSARFDQSGDECGHGNTILASANTPALATCAAALRARAAQ